MNKMTEELIRQLEDAEYVLIGIGEEFYEKFEDIENFPDLAQGLEKIEKESDLEWAIPFLEKMYLDRDRKSARIEAYENLYQKIKDKNYFIITTCIDENIEKAGFLPERIVAPCGDYHRLQCSEGCNKELIDSAEYVKAVEEYMRNQSLLSMERPYCPMCKKPLVFNNIISSRFVEEGYLPQWELYTKWLQKTVNRKVCIIELGVGISFSNVIRRPFERIAFLNQKASFFRINESIYQFTKELEEKGVSIKGNAQEFLLRELE